MEMELENKMKKKTLGRQKIEIKKIEKKSRLLVSFSKRKHGLFKKASELAVLCGAELAILVRSPADKIYAFEQPSVETLINCVSPSLAPPQSSRRRLDYGRSKYEKAEEMSGGCCWEKPVEGLGLQDLENYMAELEGLKENVVGKLGKFEGKATINSDAALSIQDLGFCASTPDGQDLGFCASSPSYVDLCASSPSYDDLCASSPSYVDLCASSPSYVDLCASSPSYVDLCASSPSYVDLCASSPSYVDLCASSPSYVDVDLCASSPSYVDVDLCASSPSYADQDLGFCASSPSYVDQDFNFCASSPSYADQDQDLGFYASSPDQDFGFCASSPSFPDRDLSIIFN